MGLYRVKHQTVKATQWHKMGDHPAVSLQKSYSKHTDFPDGAPWLNTPEGGVIVRPGDWVIELADGRFIRCREEDFQTQYEVA